MYAVIIAGGKQYRVEVGQSIKIDKIELDVGANVEFDKVLMVANGEQVTVGAPYVANAKVTASIEQHGRDKKVKILKFKRRKHHMKSMGHRQWYTKVKIDRIGE